MLFLIFVLKTMNTSRNKISVSLPFDNKNTIVVSFGGVAIGKSIENLIETNCDFWVQKGDDFSSNLCTQVYPDKAQTECVLSNGTASVTILTSALVGGRPLRRPQTPTMPPIPPMP